MSLADVRGAFKTLFDTSTMRAITPNAYDHDILEDSNYDARKMLSEKEVNFWVYLVTKQVLQKLSGAEQETYNIEFKYYRFADKAGDNQAELFDTFEELHSNIRTVLGTTLSGTVDFYRSLDRPITKTTLVLDGKPCWVGSSVYEAVRTVTV